MMDDLEFVFILHLENCLVTSYWPHQRPPFRHRVGQVAELYVHRWSLGQVGHKLLLRHHVGYFLVQSRGGHSQRLNVVHILRFLQSLVFYFMDQ